MSAIMPQLQITTETNNISLPQVDGIINNQPMDNNKQSSNNLETVSIPL